MQRRRRSLPLLLLFLLPFASALLLLLPFLECNCRTTLCIVLRDRPSRPSVAPIHKALPFHTLRENSEQPHLTPQESSRLFAASAGGRPPPPSPVFVRSTRMQRRRALVKTLKPNGRSWRFSERAAEFFRGNRKAPPCRDRFFMAWISPVDSFGPRELFSIESLFNSHRNACLLIVSNTMDSARGALLFKPFSDRGFRVKALSPDFSGILHTTPAARWFERLRRGEVDPGDVPLGQNLSNLLRLAVLYKYGGAYLDTDVIVLRSFSGLRNAIGAQAVDAGTGNWTRLNNAVMVFDRKHPLLYEFMREFALTFDGSKWGHNGPYLVSRVAVRQAGKAAYGFTALPPAAFYPVGWKKIATLFAGPGNESQRRWIAENLGWIRARSYALHLWNSQSRGVEIEEGSVLSRIMSDCCVICNVSTPAMQL